jgi:hypothetical protein
VSDSSLFRVLNNVYAKVQSDNVGNMSVGNWASYMWTLNTTEFWNSNYYSYDGYLAELNGVFSGHEINYLAVGMGFGAKGFSVDMMNLWIYAWKDSQYLQNAWPRSRWSRLPYSGMRGGELMWAQLGYVYYTNGGHL